MTTKLLLICILCFMWVEVFAQRLHGIIKSADTKESLQASVFIKDLNDRDLIKEFYQSNESGEFDFQIQNYTSKIVLEIRVMGYAPYVDSLVNVEVKRDYLLEIQLKPESVELETVIISTDRSVVVKKDTVDYYAKAFLNGTERKVEDLIKRLPGMEVSESGRIKYLGKVVESVQLDGDDLFGDKYNVGTKNIAVDLVEKVQAIDNFTANPLLKGLVNSETVSLNIVLKKTKIVSNAEASVGLGIGDKSVFKKDIGLNVLVFNNRIKSFGNFTHNNVGNDSYNNANNVYKAEQYGIEVVPQIAEKLLPDDNIYSSIKTNYARINNEYAGSANFLSRLSKKILVKSNINFSKDELSKTEFNKIIFFGENVKYDDQISSKNKPFSKEFTAKIEYTIDKKNLVIFESTIHIETITQNSSSIQNQINSINNFLISNSKYWLNKVIFTRKLNENSALQLKSFFTKSINTQGFSINTLSNLNNIGDYQKSDNQLYDIQNHLLYFSKIKTTKFNISIGNLNSQTLFSSTLLKDKNALVGFKNYSNFFSAMTYLNSQIAFEKNNWRFSPEIKLASILTKLNDNAESSFSEKKSFVMMPKFLLDFKPSKLQRITFSGNIEFTPAAIRNLYFNGILENNRTITKNILSLNLQKVEQLNLAYIYHEPFEFFRASVDIFIKRSFNTFLSNVTYDKNYTTTTFFRAPTNVLNNGINIGLDKFVPILKSSFKYSGSLALSNYKNIINNSAIRNNVSFSQTHELFMKTGFSLPFGFENNFSINRNKFITDNFSNNVLTGWNNNFKFLLRPNNQILLISTLNTFVPQTKQKNSFHFFDFELSFNPVTKSKAKKIEYRLIGKNLLNTNFFKTTQNSDFAVVSYQSNLIGRFVMSSVLFRF